MSHSSASPLSGVRVLELGNYIAAPTAGRMLADFGAEVIKVERPGTGDELRRWRLYSGDTSMLYRTINRNKKSLVLDLGSPEGRAAVVELVKHCDVLIENFRPGTLEKWSIGPEVLKEANPELIISRISAFGQTGPLSSRPGFAAVAEGYGGLRNLIGEADRPPARVGVSIGDSIAGLYAALGVAMMLFDRERGRERAGSSSAPVIDVALNEVILSMMESLVPDYEAFGVLRQRTGGRVEGIAPSNAYLCADSSSVIIAGNGDSIFLRLMEVIGRPDLAADPQLSENAGRWERRDDLDAAIEGWTSAHSSEHVLAALAEAGVPAGPIYSAADITKDEQYRARNMIQKFSVSTGSEVIDDVGFTGIVPVLGDVSASIRTLGPELGEHTDEILGGMLGMSSDEISAVTGGARAAE
ncbi:CoA transferase [Salinibacterium sp. dk2585]|uniref:CaiB/BaiF CoA transferase family protein n=1 Tax=unclassified Salinibacterium TaxID=2632331 RepID=UPI0011C24B43|nr:MULTISPECIES: CaiB/BaiF CoA-transferase family protein [unclassified Salinibacterium]QEE60424.1 CoA transferase [Salinibacterium sp. dk2585]TXK55497.1 CoA transferase [Salinibacterium sp. dk5596]